MRRWNSLRPTRAGLGLALALVALLVPSVAAAEAPPRRLIDVVQVTWPGAPALKSDAAAVAKVVQDDTIERWKQITNGRVVFTFDAIMPAVTVTQPLTCDDAGTAAFVNAVALKVMTASGYQNWDQRYLIIASPDPGGCIWDGQGFVNPPTTTQGLLVLKDNAYPSVIAHELGHNLGLGHSNLETCAGGRADGPWVDCSAVEYGSVTDLMGNLDVTTPLAAYHQWRLGLIPDADVALGNRSMSVTLKPVDTITGTRALFVRDASAAYWVEYRRESPESGVHAGLAIYRTDPPPASSVVSPFGPVTEQVGTELTRQVWLISLGDYTYGEVPTGSPTLAASVPFTTAFGGVTLVARPEANGTVTVDITRKGGVPAAPVWTDRATWTGPLTPLIRSDLDDGGVAIDHFEARLAMDTGTTVVALAPTTSSQVRRTYLTPLGTPVTVLAGALPEGRFGIELRAINVDGVAGPWSSSMQLSVDHGAPKVSPEFAITGVTPTREVTVRWTGARDPGVGVCAARGFDDEGFAMLQWRSTDAGSPVFDIAPVANRQYMATVQDCFGNVSWGTLDLATKWSLPNAFKRTGAWSSGTPSQCTGGACTASIRTGEGTTALVVGKGSGTVLIDGKRVATIAASSSAAARIGYRVQGSHVVMLKTSDLHLFGAQTVNGAWTDTATPEVITPPADASLSDDAQAALAQYGFVQSDFASGITVRPMSSGTTTEQPTLDLCNGSFPSESERQYRRQVYASRVSDDPYLFLSTETVRYWSPQAVRRAITEIDAAAKLCKSRGYALSGTNTKEPYAFSTLPPLPVGLRPAADRRIYRITIGEGDQARSLLIAYQFKGATLSALYVVRKGANSIDDAMAARWLAVAAVIAKRLSTAT